MVFVEGVHRLLLCGQIPGAYALDTSTTSITAQSGYQGRSPWLVSLLPPIIGAAVAGPMWTILTLLLLRGEGGLIKAAAFAAGAMTVRLLQMILFGYVFGTADGAGGEAGPDLIAS